MEHPRLQIIKRDDSTFLNVLFWPLKKITGQTYDTAATTIFSTIYVPSNWMLYSTDGKYLLLRHEMTHVRRFNNWPLGKYLWPLNNVITALLYLFCLPVVFTMRSWFEREAYTQTLLVMHELGMLEGGNRISTANWLRETFSNSTYLYMWDRGPAAKWIERTISDIESGKITNEVDKV